MKSFNPPEICSSDSSGSDTHYCMLQLFCFISENPKDFFFFFSFLSMSMKLSLIRYFKYIL